MIWHNALESELKNRDIRNRVKEDQVNIRKSLQRFYEQKYQGSKFIVEERHERESNKIKDAEEDIRSLERRESAIASRLQNTLGVETSAK